MIPWIIAGAAAALILMGCNEEEKTTEDNIPRPTPPPSQNPPAPVIPPPTYKTDFKNYPLAENYYQILINKYGISNADLDRGIVYYGKIQGEGDRTIDGREVFNHFVLNPQKYPQYIKEIFGGPRPWDFDDGNPFEFFDDEIQDKIKAAIENLKTDPALKGLDPQSEPYQTNLAIGLFFFIDFPDDPQRIKNNKKALEERTAELRRLGMGQFRNFLFDKGGLGTSMLSDLPHRSIGEGAMEALSSKKFSPTDITLSNILYGALEMAGLKPSFHGVPMSYADPHQDFEEFKGRHTVVKDSMTVVGLNLGKTTRYLNLLTLTTNGDYPDVTRQSLLQNMLKNLKAKGYSQLLRGQTMDGIETLNRYLEIKTNSSDVLVMLGSAHKLSGKKGKAREYFEMGLHIDPDYSVGWNHLGELSWEEGKHEEALGQYLKSMKGEIPIYYKNWLKTYREAAVQFLKKDPKNSTAQELIRILNEYQEKSSSTAPREWE